MKYFATMFLLLFLIISNENLHAQWVQTNGPFVGDCNFLAADGNNLVAGLSSLGGLFLTTNNGTNWTLIKTGSNINALFMNDTYLIVAMNDSIYLSTNKGKNWTNGGFLFNAVSIASIDTILFAASAYGIFRSTDKGKNWIDINSGFQNITTLAANDSNLFAGTFDKGIFHSTNNGTTWNQINSGLINLRISSLAILPDNLNKMALFAGTIGNYNGAEIFISTDNGSNWYPSYSGIISEIGDFVSMPDGLGGKIIFVGVSGYGVYRSTNNGSSWNKVNNGLIELGIMSLVVNGNALVAGTQYGGAFQSTDFGANWIQINNGFPTVSGIYALVVKGDNIFASNGRNVSLSSDNGSHWKDVNKFSEDYEGIVSLAVIDSNIFIGSNLMGVFRSSDNGSHWFNSNKGLWTEVYALASNGTNLFAGTGAGPFISTDKGSNWLLCNNGITPSVVDNSAFAFAFNGSKSYVLTEDGVFLSTDNGADWKDINSGLPPAKFKRRVLCTAVSGTNLFVGASQFGMFLSTDDGLNWYNVYPFDQYSFNEITLLTAIGNNILTWISGDEYNEDKLYLSTDFGNSWSGFRDGLPNASITCLTFSGTNLFAGTNGAGVWKRPLSDFPTGITKEVNALPKDYTLSQNYPNPFNPNTVISYSLPSSSNVKLIVYNTLGQTIKTLESGYKPAGSYSVNFNASAIPSGIYFYKLEAGSFSQIKKMMLIK